MKKSHRYISFLVLAVAAALTSGCELSDPGCVSDTECRQGRLCIQGACTGDVPVQNNGDQNNGDTNNGIVHACMSAEDCEPGEEVCSWADDTRALACVDDWTCDSFDGNGEGEECVLRWWCDGLDQIGVECSALDDGSAGCMCYDATGPIAEFVAEPGACGGEYNVFVDAANIACGFRIPMLMSF